MNRARALSAVVAPETTAAPGPYGREVALLVSVQDYASLEATLELDMDPDAQDRIRQPVPRSPPGTPSDPTSCGR